MCMQICFDIVAPPSACHNKLAMRLAVSPRGMLALLLATVIAGALLVCSTVVQSNIQTFIGPNGTEYVALQWATQLQWQPPPGPVMPPDDFGADIDDWTGWASWSDAGPDAGAAAHGQRGAMLAFAALAAGAQRAEDDAAGAIKAQQMAITTAGVQLALLLDCAVQVGVMIWPASTTNNAEIPATNLVDEQLHVVAGFTQVHPRRHMYT